ncbi:hypothetical protein H5T87_05450 [bacterium]|nr:hypothetical protein [bacterium]
MKRNFDPQRWHNLFFSLNKYPKILSRLRGIRILPNIRRAKRVSSYPRSYLIRREIKQDVGEKGFRFTFPEDIKMPKIFLKGNAEALIGKKVGIKRFGKVLSSLGTNNFRLPSSSVNIKRILLEQISPKVNIGSVGEKNFGKRALRKKRQSEDTIAFKFSYPYYGTFNGGYSCSDAFYYHSSRNIFSLLLKSIKRKLG